MSLAVNVLATVFHNLQFFPVEVAVLFTFCIIVSFTCNISLQLGIDYSLSELQPQCESCVCSMSHTLHSNHNIN